jgi:hypothetical protein
MFEIVPGIPIIILKQPPPPIVPLPHLLKAVKLGLEPKNREIALRGGIFQLPAIAPPKQKSRLKKVIVPKGLLNFRFAQFAQMCNFVKSNSLEVR